ncbi:hypothetical protein STEG23_024692, partial [Scotinomys teguina]
TFVFYFVLFSSWNYDKVLVYTGIMSLSFWREEKNGEKGSQTAKFHGCSFSFIYGRYYLESDILVFWLQVFPEPSV